MDRKTTHKEWWYIFRKPAKKTFAEVLLYDRKVKKKGCYNVFTTSTTDSTLLRRTDQTTVLRKETKPVETLKREREQRKINATDELLHLVLWPTGIDRSPPCIRMPPPLAASFCCEKFFYFSLFICSTKNRSWGHQSFSYKVYLSATCIYASNHGATQYLPLCRLLRAQTKFSRWAILVLRRDSPCTNAWGFLDQRRIVCIYGHLANFSLSNCSPCGSSYVATSTWKICISAQP
jgi:hypothetical protein